jgi:hypothetical protein
VTVVIVSAIFAGVVAAPSQADELAPVDTLIAAFDDPTQIARQIDQRVKDVLAACMNTRGFQYPLPSDARFEVSEATIQADLQPRLELTLTELVPRVADPQALDSEVLEKTEFQPVAPGQIALDPQSLDPDLEQIQDTEKLPPSFEFGRTDNELRLEPSVEGYGISLDAYSIEPRNPYLDTIESLEKAQLVEYEVAFYGAALDDFVEDTTVTGCAQEVQALLDAEITPLMEGITEELDALNETIEADDVYQRSLQSWSECIAEAGVGSGLDLARPDDAVAEVDRRFDALEAQDDAGFAAVAVFETSLAEADYACRALTTDPAIAGVVLRDGADLAQRMLDVSTVLAEGN